MKNHLNLEKISHVFCVENNRLYIFYVFLWTVQTPAVTSNLDVNGQRVRNFCEKLVMFQFLVQVMKWNTKRKNNIIIANDCISDVVPIDTSDDTSVEPSEMPSTTTDGQPITSSQVSNQPITSSQVTSQPIISSHQTSFPQTSQPITNSQEDSQPISSSQVTSQPIASSQETSQPITSSEQITTSTEPSAEPSSSSEILLGSSSSETPTLQTVFSTPTTQLPPSMSTSIKSPDGSSSTFTPDITPTASSEIIEHTCNEQRKYSNYMRLSFTNSINANGRNFLKLPLQCSIIIKLLTHCSGGST